MGNEGGWTAFKLLGLFGLSPLLRSRQTQFTQSPRSIQGCGVQGGGVVASRRDWSGHELVTIVALAVATNVLRFRASSRQQRAHTASSLQGGTKIRRVRTVTTRQAACR